MPPLPHDNVSKLEAGQSKGLEEKSSSEHVGGSSSRIGRTEDSNNRAPMERMPSAGRLLVTLLLSFLVTFGLATALSPRDWHRRAYQRGDAVREHIGMEAEEDGVSFTSLLQAASPNSLHDLLHKYFPERFKDGVWESDASAVEAVRRVDAVLAASIVQLARRADNGTTTSPTSTTPPPPDSTTTDAPPTTTPPPDGGTGTSTEPSNTAPPPTSSNSPGQTSTTTTRGSSSTTTVPPSSSRTTTTGRSNTSPGTSTSADSTRPSSSPATSSTTHSSSFVTASHSGPLSSSISRGGTSNPTTGKPTFTSAPLPRPVTSTFTSTMDNGGVVVITTTSFVNPDPAVTGPSSTRPTPTLQNAAPAKFSHGPGALSVVVVAGVALLI